MSNRVPMAEARAVRAVTLDAAGTLIRVAQPVGDTYAAYAWRFGGRARPAAIAAAFREVFPSMPPLAFAAAAGADLAGLERGWWRELVRAVFAHAGVECDLDACFDALYAHYAGAGAWQVYPEVIGVLDALTARGLRVGVVSNFDSRLHGILDGLGLAPRFHAVLCSTGAGFAKPDARIFRRALDALDATPTATLHVGDSPDADYAGAQAAGLHALLVDRRGGPGAGRVRSLEGVIDWLGA